MDSIDFPDVVTQLKAGNFTLYIHAYRTLSKSESKHALAMFLKQKGLKKIPTSGSGEVFTHFGSNPSDDL